MYSANLTSLLARPGRGNYEIIRKMSKFKKNVKIEKPITNLYQLETAMLNRGYQLFVERHSSSFSLLEV